MNNEWISGDIKPDKKGIYTRNNFGDIRISKWDGKKWNDLFFKYPTDKKEFSKSYYQNLEWRNSTDKENGNHETIHKNPRIAQRT